MMNDDIYVVVAENDKTHIINGKEFFDDCGPLVFEQYTKTSDFESIQNRARSLSRWYGKCRIAKLVFVDGETYE